MGNIEQILENSFLENQKLSQQARKIISEYVGDFDIFFYNYGIEIDFDNLCTLVSTLDMKDSDKISSPVEYDSESNSFLFPKDLYFTQSDIERAFQKAVLSMVTNVCSIETDRYNEGLTFQVDGKEYGKIVNEKVKDRIVEIIYGSQEDKVVTLPTTTDSLCHDFENMIGSENLLTYFVNGRGDLMYLNVASLFNSNEECMDFFKNLNRYVEVDPNDMRELRKIDKKYEEKRDEILQNRKENALAM